MNLSALFEFLSEESVAAHREYLYKKKVEYSILELSEPKLSGASFEKIIKMRLDKELKREAYRKKRNIDLHELYFFSFTEKRGENITLPQGYRSTAELQYHIFTVATEEECHSDFLTVLFDTRTGGLRPTTERDVGSGEIPVLAIDLAEHAYFSDYGFEREEYVKAAVARLDLRKISDFAEGFKKKRERRREFVKNN